MQHRTSPPRVHNWKIFVSVLVSYLILIAPLAPVAATTAANSRSRQPHKRGARQVGGQQQGAAAEAQRVQSPAAQPTPAAPSAVNITATKADSFTDSDGDGKAELGETINYTVTITNSGTTDAAGVVFSDTVDTNTTVVPNSVHASPVAINDAYTWVSNTVLDTSARSLPSVTSNDTAPTDTLTVDTLTNAPTALGGTVTLSANGHFVYTPEAGDTGNDSFTYTIRNSTDNTLSSTGTVTINLGTLRVWYVQNAGTNGNGTSGNPFNSPASASTAANQPTDIIYIFSDTGNPKLNGNFALDTGQQLIGQGLALVVNTIALFSAGSAPTITNTGGNAITLNSTGGSNTVRGLIVGNTSGAKIFGNNFGTLTVGDSTAQDVTLNGTGQALNLTTGNFAATSGFASVTTTSSGTQGIVLSAVGGTVAFGSTTVSGSTTQGILLTGSTATINFGNTSVTGGTDGVSLQNNSGGTRTFGTLSISGNTLVGFLHSGGGGVVNVTGATTVTNPGGTGIDIQSSNANLTFAATTVNKGTSGGTGVNLATNSTRIMTFNTLAVATSNGIGLNATGGGTINVTNGTGSSISATGIGATVAPAINANGVTLGANFTTVSSTNSGGSGTGITLATVSGTLTVNNGGGTATTVTNPGGVGIDINNSSVVANFGNTVVNASGNTGVSLATNSGALTFADFDIAPDSGQRALLATNNTGTITSTSGTLSTTNATAVSMTGASAASRTPLNMTLTSVSAAATGGNPPNGIELVNTNGPGANVGFVVNGDGSNTARGGNSTGGTIASTTGADGATTGIGIRLNTVDEATFRRMTIAGQPNFAIKGDTVANITIEYTTANGTNGTVAPEGSFIFDNLTGAASILGCNIANAVEDNVRVRNSSGTLNRLVINDCGIGANSTTTGGDGLLVVSDTTAIVNVTVQNTDFTNSRGDLMQTSVTNTATLDLILTGSRFSNNNAAILAAGGGTTFGGSGTGSGSTFTYNINNNTFRDAVGIALNINHTGGVANSSGRIENNVIGVVGVPNSGSTTSNGIAFQSGAGGGTHTVLINNNQVRHYNNHGILLQFGDQQGIAKNVSATVTNNTVNTPGTGPNTDYNGIHLNNGTVSTDNFTSCIDIRLNNIVGSGKGTIAPNNQEFRLRQRQSTTVRLPGYGGANNNDAAVVAFIQGQNTETAGNGAASNTVPTGGGFIGGAACAQPAIVQIGPDNASASASATDNAATPNTALTNNEQSSITSGRPFVSLPRQVQQPVQVAATTNRSQTSAANTKAASKTGPAQAAPNAPTANLPVNVGALPAGKSITIKFQVNVNSSFTGTQTFVSNQGKVEYTGGPAGGILTDDPSVAGGNDQTVTPVDIVSLSLNDVSVAEGAVGQRVVTLTVSLSQTTNNPVSVHYSTANNTATAPADYTAVPDTVLNIPGNAPSATFTVLVNGDTLYEGNENFFVNLSTPSNNALLSDTQSIVTIADDEPQVADLTGDGFTDAAIWNSANGNWFVRDSNTGTLSLATADWGRASLGDIAVPGDYDGDNKIDIAIWRPSEGNWYVLKSGSANAPSIQGWGQSGDVPVPGDYNNDGKTDYAVWRPSEGNWYILLNGGGNSFRGWGTAGDKPVPGDYDGDGQTDIAVFRPSEGNWYVINSSTGAITRTNWGLSTDKLVPGDYDGDGKTDHAVYRGGVWFIRNSSGGSTVKSWGNASDLAVPGDYDGDGKFDISIWRSSEGNWYTIRSSNNTVLLQNIQVTGVPVPNAYLPQ